MTMPNHMTKDGVYYWLERAECPPRPLFGHGNGADRATLEWRGPGWYGPGSKVVSYRDDREVIYYERADQIKYQLQDEIRDAAMRLVEAKRFAKMM